jgi:hypothetical protein
MQFLCTFAICQFILRGIDQSLRQAILRCLVCCHPVLTLRVFLGRENKTIYLDLGGGRKLMAWTSYRLRHSSGQPRNSCSKAERDNDLNLRQQIETFKNTVFRGTSLFNPFKVNRLFGESYILHLQGRKILWLPPTFMLVRILLSLFDLQDQRDMFLGKVGSFWMGYTTFYPRRQYSL